MGFIYYFILWPIILYISFVIHQIFGLVILLIVLREYWMIYKLGTMNLLTRILASDKGWFKQYAKTKKSADDTLALSKKMLKDRGLK